MVGDGAGRMQKCEAYRPGIGPTKGLQVDESMI